MRVHYFREYQKICKNHNPAPPWHDKIGKIGDGHIGDDSDPRRQASIRMWSGRRRGCGGEGIEFVGRWICLGGAGGCGGIIVCMVRVGVFGYISGYWWRNWRQHRRLGVLIFEWNERLLFCGKNGPVEGLGHLCWSNVMGKWELVTFLQRDIERLTFWIDAKRWEWWRQSNF